MKVKKKFCSRTIVNLKKNGITLQIALSRTLTLWPVSAMMSGLLVFPSVTPSYYAQFPFPTKLQLVKRKKSSRLSPSRLIARSQRCSLPYSSSHVATANGVRWEIESERNRQMKGGKNNCPSLSLTHLLWEWEREGVTYHHLLSVSSRDGWNRFKTTGNSSSWTPQ